MFHWICPECGREIPPTVKECQACDPNAAINAAVEPAPELAAAPVKPVAITPDEARNPDRENLCENGPRSTPPLPAGLHKSLIERTGITSPAGDQPAPPVAAISHPDNTIDAEARPSEALPAEIANPVEPVPIPVAAAPAPSPVREGGDDQIAEPVEPPVVVTASDPREPTDLEPRPAGAVSAEDTPQIAELPIANPAEALNPVREGGDHEPAEAGAIETEPRPTGAVSTLEVPQTTELHTEPVTSSAEPAAIPVDTAPAPPVVEPPIAVDAAPTPQMAPLLPAPHRPVTDEFAETLELPIPRLSAPYLILHPPRSVNPVDAAPAPQLVEPSEPAAITAPAPNSDPESLSEKGNRTPPLPGGAGDVDANASLPVTAGSSRDVFTQAREGADKQTVEIIDAEAPEPEPTPEPLPAEANAPEPPSIAQPPAPETLIPVHELPDPLLALAEEIRAAQAARAATGLFRLAGAVGVREPEPEPTAAPAETSSTSRLEPPQPEHVEATALETSPVETAAPIALLAAPEPSAALADVNVPEPAGIQDARPVAFAPAPAPAAEPEPTALAEPQVQPAALATEPGREGPTLPLAPLQHYTPATSSSIQPARPPVQILAAETGPRITLPGPTLPPQLARLHEANVVTIIGEDTALRKKEAIEATKPAAGAPNWLVSGLVMMLLLAVGLAAVFYLFPHSVADAKPAPTPATAATSPAPTSGNSPLAKFIEVTGFRIITSPADANKKSEVQYLVVNHSDADISDANVFITLRGIKPGQAPLCRFSFKIPSLGPYESKEMSSPIEKSPRALALPDWQDLRAEVQISQ